MTTEERISPADLEEWAEYYDCWDELVEYVKHTTLSRDTILEVRERVSRLIHEYEGLCDEAERLRAERDTLLTVCESAQLCLMGHIGQGNKAPVLHQYGANVPNKSVEITLERYMAAAIAQVRGEPAAKYPKPTQPVECVKCKGLGYIPEQKQIPYSCAMHHQAVCPHCHGTGQEPENKNT